MKIKQQGHLKNKSYPTNFIAFYNVNFKLADEREARDRRALPSSKTLAAGSLTKCERQSYFISAFANSNGLECFHVERAMINGKARSRSEDEAPPSLTK